MKTRSTGFSPIAEKQNRMDLSMPEIVANCSVSDKSKSAGEIVGKYGNSCAFGHERLGRKSRRAPGYFECEATCTESTVIKSVQIVIEGLSTEARKLSKRCSSLKRLLDSFNQHNEIGVIGGNQLF